MKITGRVGRDLYAFTQFTDDRTSEIHLMAIHCAAAERSGLIKKKERKFMGKTYGLPD